MRKSFSIIAALVAALMLLAASASADVIYTRQDTNYSNTSLGIITAGGVPTTTLQSNIGGNNGQTIFPITDAGGAYRVLVSLYTMNQGDVINVYSPGGDRTSPAAWSSPRNATTSLHNTRALAYSGGHIYGIDYDLSTVSKMVVLGDTLTELKTWKFPGAENTQVADAYAHGEAIVAHKGYIYAIFTRTDGGNVWEGDHYIKSRIVKLDRDLTAVWSDDIEGRNVDGFGGSAICLDGDDLYIVSRGGIQNTDGTYNDESRIELVDLSGTEPTVKTLITAQQQKAIDASWTHDFAKIAINGDKVYVLGTCWPADGGYSIKMYETTRASLKAGNIGTSAKLTKTGSMGYGGGMVYDADDSALYFSTGYTLIRYANGIDTELSTTQLGGNVSAIAPAAAAKNDDTKVEIKSRVDIDEVTIAGGTVSVTDKNKVAPEEIRDAIASGKFGDAITLPGDMQILDLSVINTSELDVTAYPTGTGRFTAQLPGYAVVTHGYDLCALIKKTGGAKYDIFKCTLSGGTAAFDVANVREYFSKNDVVFAEVKSIGGSNDDTPPTGTGIGGGGCSTGAAFVAVAALFAIRRRRK